MAGASMFILWANSDGTITLSQRAGAGEFEPEVDPSPARVATVSDALSAVRSSLLFLSPPSRLKSLFPADIRHGQICVLDGGMFALRPSGFPS